MMPAASHAPPPAPPQWRLAYTVLLRWGASAAVNANAGRGRRECRFGHSQGALGESVLQDAEVVGLTWLTGESFPCMP